MARDASIGVNLVGRDVSASKALRGVGDQADRLAHKMNDVSNRIIKGMAVAGMAVAAAAVKIGVDAVKAAVEDQKSSAMLTQALRANADATRKQIDAVDDYITKQQLRFGVDDDLLKNGLARLVRSTKDVTKAQDLLNLSLDVSAGTGKNLDTVTTALAKAYGGNLGALSRLGVTIDKGIIKNKDLGGALKVLEKAYGGAATAAANTFAGKLARTNEAIAVAREKLGYVLLPYVERFAKYVADELVPALDDWIDRNGDKVRAAIENALPKIQNMLTTLQDVGRWAIDHKDVLWSVAKAFASIVAGMKTFAAVSAFAGAIKGLAAAFGLVRTAAAGAAVAEAAATGGGSVIPALAGMAAIAAGLATYGIASGAISLGGDKGSTIPQTIELGGRQRPNPAYAKAANRFNAIAPQVNVTLKVAGNVTTEADLTKAIQGNLTQWLKRQGVDSRLLGQGKQ